jgi:HEPN domain-containing protein
MKPMTREWIEKAEGDFATMERESRARKSRNNDAVCFHAQQCAEKYLKACLAEAGLRFAKIHDLVALLHQAIAVHPSLLAYQLDLAYLSDFAVSYRYPGESADRQTALDARRRCRRFRAAARGVLGLSP